MSVAEGPATRSTPPGSSAPLLQVEDLTVQFRTHEGTVYAVNGISFELEEGERLGLVGESGCGKSVTNLAIMRLLPKPAGRIEGGQVIFDGQNIVELREEEIRDIRGRDIAMIFQDPMTSLNPVLTIEEQMVETIRAHKKVVEGRCPEPGDRAPRDGRDPRPGGAADELPAPVLGRDAPAGDDRHGPGARAEAARSRTSRRPRSTSRSRPRSSSSSSGSRPRRGTALILITHDLGVVAGHDPADQRDVRRVHRRDGHHRGPVRRPSHPYTVGLLHSIPRLDAVEGEELIPIEGRPPDMRLAPVGCPFAPRCAWRLEVCWTSNPPLVSLSPDRPIVTTGPEASHRIACHNPPIAEEAAAGRPLRPGFQAAPPPGDEQLANVVDELAVAAEEAALIDETLRETGSVSTGPSAAGLPIQPDPPDRRRR